MKKKTFLSTRPIVCGLRRRSTNSVDVTVDHYRHYENLMLACRLRFGWTLFACPLNIIPRLSLAELWCLHRAPAWCVRLRWWWKDRIRVIIGDDETRAAQMGSVEAPDTSHYYNDGSLAEPAKLIRFDTREFYYCRQGHRSILHNKILPRKWSLNA